MADRYLSSLWSQYTISPDPLSGMQSIRETCMALTRQALHPLHIIPAGCGFILHSSLAKPLAGIAPILDHLLRCAAKYHGVRKTSYIRPTNIQILCGTTACGLDATHCQIVVTWVFFMDELVTAMDELEQLCKGDPFSRAHPERPSRIPHIVASLSPLLRTTLPPSVFEFFGICIVDEAQKTVSKILLHSESTRTPVIHTEAGGQKRRALAESDTCRNAKALTAAGTLKADIAPLARSGLTPVFHANLHTRLHGYPAVWHAGGGVKGYGMSDPETLQHGSSACSVPGKASAAELEELKITAPIMDQQWPHKTIADVLTSDGTLEAINLERSILSAQQIADDTCALELGGPQANCEILQQAADLEATGLSADGHTSEILHVGSIQSSFPASACELQELKNMVNQQSKGIYMEQAPTSESSVNASGSPSCPIPSTRLAASASCLLALGSSVPDIHRTPPAPALVRNEDAVKLGGLKESLVAANQEAITTRAEIHTSQLLGDAHPPPSPVPPAPALVVVELGGQRLFAPNQQSTAAEHLDPRTCSPVHAPGAPTPAPALVFDEHLVELGGRSENLFALDKPRTDAKPSDSLTDSETRPRVAPLATLPLTPPVYTTAISLDTDFTFVSAIVRTFCISNLGHSLVGVVAPDTEWEREGIGTRCSI
ncbi:hypothetical protein B0H13DRAFT_2333832 [Mycena leptocephala]|nr:hypothetical protein B0H13DRAFT_2333832 [Mycena leptocephala]